MKKRYGITLDILYYAVPPLLSLFVILLVYVIKGVYPFGDSDISYYDMIPQYIPYFARNYEIFHGQESIIFDWLAGSGMDMTGSLGYTVSPTNFIFLFIKPEFVLDFMSIFLIMKLISAALCASLFLRKTYSLPLFLHITLCMIYTFSGYVVQYYVNIFFLDQLMLFPLIILATRYMFQKGKNLPYILLMTVEISGSFYFGFMTLLFVLFYSFGVMYTVADKTARKGFAARLGIGTVLSVVLSSFLFLPTILKSADSTRFRGVDHNIFDLLRASNPESQFLAQKQFIAFNTELAVAMLILVLVRIVVKRKQFSPELYFRLFILFIMLVPLFNESINLMWHMGSYSHFPYRCGYMYVFSAIDFVAYLWKYETEGPMHDVKKPAVTAVLVSAVSVFSVIGLVLLVMLSVTFADFGIYQNKGSYKFQGAVFLLTLCAYLIVLLFAHKKTKELHFCFLSITRLVIVAVCFIAPTEDFHYVHSRRSVEGDAEVRSELRAENDYLSKAKVLYPAFSDNYSLLTGIPSLSQWTNDSTTEFQTEMFDLGYGRLVFYPNNYDWGGTAFSDALMNDKWAISYSENQVPGELYTKRHADDDTGRFDIYDMNYTFPFGILTGEEILDLNRTPESMTDYTNMINNSDNNNTETGASSEPAANSDNMVASFSHQIQIADALTGEKGELLKEISAESVVYAEPIDESYKYTLIYDIHIDAPSVLYASLRKYTYVTINGEELVRPCYDNNNNYPAEDFGLGFMFAGCYKPGDDIHIEVSNRTGDPSFDRFALLNLNALSDVCEKYSNSCATSYKAGKNRLDITADVAGKNYMFLPLEYLKGWKAEVNGEKVEIYPVMNGAFMALKLPDGHCDIVMRYTNSNVEKGVVISVIGLIALFGVFILKKFGKDLAEIRFVGNAAYCLLNITAIGALLVVYVLPMLI